MNKYVLGGFALTFLVFALSATYGFYTLQKLEAENDSLKSNFEKQTATTTPLEDLNSTISTVPVTISTTTDVDEIEEVPVDKIPEKSAAVKVSNSVQTKSVPSTPAPVVSSPVTSTAPVVKEVVKDSEPKVEENTPEIVVKNVRQAAYPDGAGGTYGSFEIEFAITPSDNNIDIKKSTNASIGTGDFALSYSIIGKDFSGVQNAKFSCPVLSDGLCKFKSDGATRPMVFTIFLTPDSEGGGTYGLSFDNLSYYQNGERKNININRKTASIQVLY